MDASYPTAPPARFALFYELRAAADLARMPLALLTARRRAPPDAAPVMIVPGFGSDDRYTRPLRRYLGRVGYRAEGWGLGRNLAGVDLRHQLDDLSDAWQVEPKQVYRGEASVPYLCDRFAERVRLRAEQLGRPVALIGWSLGGYIAREAARDLPDQVERVVTLGSPIVGGPKYTAAASFFRRRDMDLDWIENEIARRESRPIGQPITAVYSKSDAIVSWQATLDRYSPNVRHVEVRAAHLGLIVNPTVWKIIAAALDPRGAPPR